MDTGRHAIDHSAHRPYAYEPDTEVVDPEDWRPPLADVEESDMQVNVDGTWCRDLLGSTDRTACDKPYRFTITERRRPILDGALCSTCFTPKEVADATEASARRRREADGFIGINPRRRR